MTSALATVAPLGGHQVLIFLLQLGVLLLIALCLGSCARAVGLPSVVGELATGILLGPSVLGRTAPGIAGWLLPAEPGQAHLLDAVSQFAVLLMVGVAGAHLDLRMVRRRGAVVARVSSGGLLVPLGLGVAAGYLVPATLLGPGVQRTTFALFLGVALCVSAIPVIAKTLADLNLLHRDIGQLTLSVASIDDAVGWLLLSLVAAMSVGRVPVDRMVLSVLYLAGFVAVAATVGRPAVRLVMRHATRAADAGPATAAAVVMILLTAALSQALGLEAVLGAFVAGVLLASFRPAQHRLGALRTVALSVLAPIFLATAGLRIDLGALRDPDVLLAGVVMLVLATVGKFAGAYAGARLSRLSRWEGLALGAGLNARGVIEVIVASVGLRLGVLSTATYTIVVLIAVLTSVMAPPMLRWAMKRVDLNAEESIREADQAAWTSGSATGATPPAISPATGLPAG